MRTLILGGTAFLGRHLVEAALRRGDAVTIFTRGTTNPGLYPEVEQLRGDRESGLSSLRGREFDVVFDTSGYLPRVVAESANALSSRAGRYVFVSTLSVYDDAPRLSEQTPRRRAHDPASEDVTADYGPLKALCEDAVVEAFAARAIVIRPGLIVGRHDYTGRFGYWPKRVARGGEVLAPGRPGSRVWLLDARDLAAWMVEVAVSGAPGAYNVAGPGSELSMLALLEACRDVTGSDASFTWVDERFLVDHGVAPYSELPLLIPEQDGGYPFIDASRAIDAGLRFRPLEETIRDSLGNDSLFDATTAGAFGWTRPPSGMTDARELALLAEWHAAPT